MDFGRGRDCRQGVFVAIFRLDCGDVDSLCRECHYLFNL